MRLCSLLAGIGITMLGGCFEDAPVGNEASETVSEASTASPCDQGSRGCACFPNGTCDAGLVCSGGQCEPFDATTSTSTSTSTVDSTSTSGSTATSSSTSSDSTTADSSSSESDSSTGEGPAHILFTTSTQHDGAQVGGLDGADVICTELGQGLRDGPWVAVLRDVVTSIGSRVTITGDVVNTLGELLATNEAELLSGTLQNIPGYDENGVAVPSSDLAWTGSTRNDCIGWTTNEFMFQGAVGLPTDVELWLDTRTPLPCSVAPRLYCISQ
jgi:hypothetical protein